MMSTLLQERLAVGTDMLDTLHKPDTKRVIYSVKVAFGRYNPEERTRLGERHSWKQETCSTHAIRAAETQNTHG
jgi:hypothetical protein